MMTKLLFLYLPRQVAYRREHWKYYVYRLIMGLLADLHGAPNHICMDSTGIEIYLIINRSRAVITKSAI
jgi:hypothetical protein